MRAQQQVASSADASLARPGFSIDALAPADLRMQYQPMVDLQTGAVAGLEALTGSLPPSASVLAQIGSDLQSWHALGHASLRVALKVLPDDFCDPGFGATVLAMLQQHGLAAPALTLEITESALAQAGSRCAGLLADLSRAGLSLTLDDFGTGHSALSILKRSPFDTLKIDAMFVRDVGSNTSEAALCKTLIAMGHHLGMKVVADGVTTDAQCAFLRSNMCDQIQGAFFSDALDAHEVAALLGSGRRLAPAFLRMARPPRRLLLVDDEPNILAALQRLLRRDQYQIVCAGSGAQGLAVLAENCVDVIVSDQRMPGMLGADFLRKARAICPDSIRIMLSGYTELQSVTDAVNEGAIFKFLTKPWDDEQLRGHIAEAFRIKEIADDNQRLNLEVRSANHELAAANRKLEQLLSDKQAQLSLDEITLQFARELIEHLPVAIIGLDDTGMIAFINANAQQLFATGGALLGQDASAVLPQLFAPGAGAQVTHRTHILGLAYDVLHYEMGEHSASRGSLLTILPRHAAS